VFPINHRLLDPAEFLKESTHYSTKKELLESIRQQRTVGTSAFTMYTLAVKPNLPIGKQMSVRLEAEKVAKFLQSQMPQERFLVSHMYPVQDPFSTGTNASDPSKSENDIGLVVIYRGLPHTGSIRTSELCPIKHVKFEPAALERSGGSTSLGAIVPPTLTRPQLDPFDAYMCISSLPFHTRVGILSDSDSPPLPFDTKPRSEFVLQATSLSLLEDLNNEIRTLLHNAPLVDSLSLTKHQTGHTLQTHFPRLSILLTHPSLQSRHTLPYPILEILRYTLASSFPSKKRHVASGVLGSRRTHIRQFLAQTLDDVLRAKGFTAASIRRFHDDASALCSPLDKEKGQVDSNIMWKIVELTKKSEHTIEKSRKDASELVPGTMYVRGEEWDRMFKAIEKAQGEIKRDVEGAREVLRRMTL
jgi:hypothetical protein